MQPQVKVGATLKHVARVKLIEGSGKILINKRPLEIYFPIEILRSEVMRPFEVTNTLGRYDVRVKVEGGGQTGQAGAVKLGIARSLVALDEDMRGALRG